MDYCFVRVTVGVALLITLLIPLPVMMTSPYELKILKLDIKDTNKLTSKQTNILV